MATGQQAPLPASNIAAIAARAGGGAATPTSYPYKGDWSAGTTYAFGDIIRGSDDQYLRNSLVDDNVGHDPIEDYLRWGYCSNDPVNAWAAETTYAKGALVVTADRIYASITDDNLANPLTDVAHWRIVTARLADPAPAASGYDPEFDHLYEWGALVTGGSGDRAGLYQLAWALASLGAPPNNGWNMLGRLASVPHNFVAGGMLVFAGGDAAWKQYALTTSLITQNAEVGPSYVHAGPLTLTAGQTIGLISKAPTFSAGELTARVLITISNLDGTQKLTRVSENYGPFNSTEEAVMHLLDGATGDWTTAEDIGDDLTVGETAITSAAGGQFLVTAHIAWYPPSLTP